MKAALTAPPSVNDENSCPALIGSQILKWLCCMWDDEQKISSDIVTLSAPPSMIWHSGGISSSLYCLAHLCVNHQRHHFASRILFLVLVHTLDTKKKKISTRQTVSTTVNRFVLFPNGSVQVVKWSKCKNSEHSDISSWCSVWLWTVCNLTGENTYTEMQWLYRCYMWPKRWNEFASRTYEHNQSLLFLQSW